MEQYETEHYIFNYNKNSKAEKDIIEIAKYQESCLKYICNVLRMYPDFKIEYYLCNTPEEVGQIYGDNEPCNGFADLPNRIFAVYNDEVQCIGFHEDAHVISYLINRPNSCAIREGLAMYFDRKWWGIQNIDWVGYFIRNDKIIPIDELLDNEVFFANDCSITYPIMGAFTDWLIANYGMNKYLDLYKYEDTKKAILIVYEKSAEELNQAFIDYVKLFETDTVLKQRMESLMTVR